ncbi:4497_t:CDS:1, partial [Acaulospora morrowiae]
EKQEQRLDNIIATIQERLNEARKTRDQQLEMVLGTIESELATTHKLTSKQAKVLSDTVKEKLGNLKYVRDFSEDKAKSFLELLKTRLSEVKEYAEEGYEAAYNKVSSGYEEGTDKLGKGFDKMKEQLTPQKDEL